MDGELAPAPTRYAFAMSDRRGPGVQTLGGLVRAFITAILHGGGQFEAGRLAKPFHVRSEVIDAAALRLVEQAHEPGGRRQLEALLAEDSPRRLVAYVRKVVRNAAADASPERAYYRALRNHVAAIIEDGTATGVAAEDPGRLLVDGQIRRPLVAAAITEALAQPELAHLRSTLDAPESRPRAIGVLTRYLVDRYPPDGVAIPLPLSSSGTADGDSMSRLSSRQDLEETEARRRHDAPRSAEQIAQLLGDDLRLVLLRLEGLTLAEVSRRTGIAVATVGDRLSRAEEVLAAQRLKLGTLGTVREALRYLASPQSLQKLPWATQVQASELQQFLSSSRPTPVIK